MSKVFDWSTTAGSNNQAPPDGWPELMLPGKVNDCAREMMSAIAAWYADQTASLTTAGTTLAYTLATNSGYDALSDIPLLAFKVNAANTGACSLNVDGLGAKPLRKSGALGDYASGDLTAGQTLVVVYNSGTDDFEVIGPALEPEAATAEIASGTPMLFGQTAAPTGWTKLLTHNNKALRLVTGTASSGGSTSFTGVFASRTILQANLPSFTLPDTLTLPDHGHSISNGTNVLRGTDFSDDVETTAGNADDVPRNANNYTLSVGSVTSSPSIDGSVTSGGSGTAMDFAVQYVDVIMATKD